MYSLEEILGIDVLYLVILHFTITCNFVGMYLAHTPYHTLILDESADLLKAVIESNQNDHQCCIDGHWSN